MSQQNYEDDRDFDKKQDPVLLLKLLAYVKPYAAFVAIAVTALLLSTAGELSLPIILQRTIDRHLTRQWHAIDSSALEETSIRKAVTTPASVGIDNRHFFPAGALTRIQPSVRETLKTEGTLDTTDYYVFPTKNLPDADTEGLTSANIITGETHAAIASEDMSLLPPGQIRRIKQHDFKALVGNTLIFLFILIASLFLTFFQVYMVAWVSQQVMKDIRYELFSHTMTQSLEFLNKNPVGKLVTRITNDVETINEFFTTVTTSLLKDISIITGVIIALFVLNPALAAITMSVIPPLLIATIIFRVFARTAYRRVRRWVSNVNAFLSEHITGMEIVQMFSQESRCQSDFKEKNNNLLRANLGEMYVFATFRPIIDLFSSAAVALILFAGAWFFKLHIVSLGILIAFINLMEKFFRPVRDISEKFTIMQSAMTGAERIFSLLEKTEKINDEGSRRIEGTSVGLVEFNSVHFSYKAGEPVLNGIDFTARKGETVAIVGYTGAGKTTIANLLTRMWDVTSGSITLDGIDIRSLRINQLRSIIAPVLQDVFLFSGSVKENIRLGRDLSDDEVKQAAGKVHADWFIERLPHGYDTILTPDGSNLSSGERQLLSFARVIAHDPSVIVLDEATSNIDSETEAKIQDALKVLLEDRTAIVIAHRLSTIKRADRILVLSKGTIAEQGTHGELLDNKSLYYNLYKLQFEQ